MELRSEAVVIESARKSAKRVPGLLVFWNKQVDLASSDENQASLAVLDRITDRLLSNAHRMLKDAEG